MEKGHEEHEEQHQKHRSALRALKNNFVHYAYTLQDNLHRTVD